MSHLPPPKPKISPATARLDKWLWAVRLFKTRSLAATAANAGKIKCAGKSLKPSTAVKPGDVLEVPAPDGSHKRSIAVVEILDTRVGAPLAVKAYEERTAPEILAEAARRNLHERANRQLRKEGDQGRMTKRNRRIWEQVREEEEI